MTLDEIIDAKVAAEVARQLKLAERSEAEAIRIKAGYPRRAVAAKAAGITAATLKRYETQGATMQEREKSQANWEKLAQVFGVAPEVYALAVKQRRAS